MKETTLTPKHIALGARMAEFAGYNMPIVYTSISDEHMAVRESVGVFDVSHMGEFIVRGKEATQLLAKISSNNAAKLEIGDALYSCMPNHTGGIVDDLLIYRLGEEMCAEGELAFMLVVNAANIEKDWNWINENNTFDTRVIDISDHTGLLAVQGPKASELLQPLTDINLSEIAYYKFRKGRFAEVENVVVSATGYTGSGGFELYSRAEDMGQIWEAIFSLKTNYAVKPAGLGARDTLRLEMGYCLYGNDIDDSTSPIEAGLGWITKSKYGTFNSVELFREQRKTGVARKLVGFVAEGRRVPRQGYRILNKHGAGIGIVTSGTLSPCLGQPIGMGYVPSEMTQPDTQILVEAGKKQLLAHIVRPPFYRPEKQE